MVIAATWRDLGYRRIGPRDPQDADHLISTEQLATLFKQIGVYDIEHDNNGWWIRDPARVKGRSQSNAVAVAAVLDAVNYADPNEYGFVQMLQAGYYSNYQFDLSPAMRHDQVVTFSQNPRAAKGIYALTFALAGCPIPELQQFLSSVLLPAFFNVFINGKVVFLQPNYKFETRHAGMRAGYTASQYGRLDRLGMGQNPFETMERCSL
jgi:hypothetical protein